MDKFCCSDLVDENSSESEVEFSDATICGMLTNIHILPLLPLPLPLGIKLWK